ncbi:MAG: AAA family ATPase [Planctomycetes bacterium]|nr:AAA family ATPase [Planctomycetota bacterium]
MLIRAIRAENFMRFSKLELTGFPARGLIGIEGPNETGKSTIGEALLFAFFGRSRLSAGCPVSSLIRWGADSMSVEVEFSVVPRGEGDGAAGRDVADYLIYRLLDRYGTNYVKVLRLPERKEVAAGNFHVAGFISRHVRFDFEEFQQSFYHDQYEDRRVQAAQVSFFEAASGLRPMRQARDSIKLELHPMEREFSYYQKEISRNLAQIEKHARNADKLPDLKARAAQVQEVLESEGRRVADGRRRAEALRQEAGQLEGRGRRIEGLVDLSLEAFPCEVEKLGAREVVPEGLRSLAAGLQDLRQRIRDGRETALRRLDGTSPGSPAARAASLEREAAGVGRAAAWSTAGALACTLVLAAAGALTAGGLWSLGGPLGYPAALEPWRPWPEVAAAAASLLALVLSSRAVLRLRRRRREARGLAEGLRREADGSRREADLLEALDAPGALRDLPDLLEKAAACGNAAVAEKALEIRKSLAGLEGDRARWAERFLGVLAKQDKDQRSRLLGEAQKLERSAQEDAGLKRAEADRERLEAEMRECLSQAAKKEALEAKNKELEGSAAAVQEEIDLRLLALKLVEEAMGSVRTRIGPALARFVKSILPDLTQGRYRDVKVEEDLEIRVFSSEKSDFLSLHELSGGTNEALTLALRLAVSHAFTAAHTRQAQFVFLDEPFKMMDPVRAAATLRLLPRLSPDLEQFFVTRPSFGEEERRLFDCVIRTAGERTELEVACVRSARAAEGADRAAPDAPDAASGLGPVEQVVPA